MSLSDAFSVARMAELFGQCQDEIIEEWRQQAAQLLVALHLDKPTITNHLPDMVAQIIRDLGSFRGGLLSVEGSPGSPVHGVQRFHDGLDVGEVVAEYNLIRVAFNTVAERHGLFVAGDAARIINHRIDEAVRRAVMAFAAYQTSMRREQQEEHLAFIAHDLRTPLNAVSLLVEQLKIDLGEQALSATGDIFPILRRNLRRVEALVTKVLEENMPSSHEGGSFRPERRVFELWPVVQRLVLDLEPVSTADGIMVSNEIAPTLTLFADAGLISQVFQNLLANSFKYTPGGKVTLTASENDGAVTCVVSDDGAGIPPDLLVRVFDKLATDPDKDGTGLGLAIVKQIIEAHRGTVKAESILGTGATFTITIPPVRRR